MENPELYAIFPYRMYAVGKSQDMVNLARRTFMYRAYRDTGGWQQNAIQAVLLGDVGFKLHAPYQTTIECVYRNDEIKSLKVTPKERAEDVITMQPD